jgi:hypothetical protein
MRNRRGTIARVENPYQAVDRSQLKPQGGPIPDALFPSPPCPLINLQASLLYNEKDRAT